MSIMTSYAEGKRPGYTPPAAPQKTAAQQAEENWQQAQGLLMQDGPFSKKVTNQLINQNTRGGAYADATMAEQIRNDAAARGIDPTQAMRQMQQQRQASNVAFAGDLRSQAAIQNFAAQTPGRMTAAQAYLNRQITGGSTPAVTGTAFSKPSFFSGPTPSPHVGGSVFSAEPNNRAAIGGPVPAPTPTPAPAPAFSGSQEAAHAQGMGEQLVDPGGGSGWVRNDSTGKMINIVPNKPAPKPAFSTVPTVPQGGYVNGRQYGAIPVQY